MKKLLMTITASLCVMVSSVSQAMRWDVRQVQFPYLYVPNSGSSIYCPNYEFSSSDIVCEEEYLNTPLIIFNQRHIALIINKWLTGRLETRVIKGFPKELAQLIGLYVKRMFDVRKEDKLWLPTHIKFFNTIQLTKSTPNELIGSILYSRFIVPWCFNLPGEDIRCSAPYYRSTAKKLMSLKGKSLYNNYYNILLSLVSEYRPGTGHVITETMSAACGEVSCLTAGYINRNFNNYKAYQLEAVALPQYQALLKEKNIYIDHSLTLVVDKRKVSLTTLQVYNSLNHFCCRDGFIFIDPWLRIAYTSTDPLAHYYIYATLLIASNLHTKNQIEMTKENLNDFGNKVLNFGYFKLIDY